MKDNEKNLIKALELYESGKKPADILTMFPEAKTELKELFATVEILGDIKKGIKPEPRLLHEILKKIESRATPSASGASLAPQNAEREEQVFAVHRRRFHWWQTLVPVGALALLLIIFLSSLGSAPGVSKFAENPLDLNAIKAETAAADFNPDLYAFLDEEKELQEIDAALANF